VHDDLNAAKRLRVENSGDSGNTDTLWSGASGILSAVSFSCYRSAHAGNGGARASFVAPTDRTGTSSYPEARTAPRFGMWSHGL